MLPGETVVVLSAGTMTDPFSGEQIDDWDTATAAPVENVLVERVTAEQLRDVRDAVTTRLTLYFQGDPGVTVTGRNQVEVRGTNYAVSGEPADFRMGDRFGLTVDVIDLLAARRATAEALMVDTCRVEHPTGSTVDPGGVEVFTYDEVYTGKCRVRVRADSQSAALRAVGDQQVSLMSVEVEVPVVGTEGIRVRDRVTVVRATHDADLLNREFRVEQAAAETDAPLRLLSCLEVTA